MPIYTRYDASGRKVGEIITATSIYPEELNIECPDGGWIEDSALRIVAGRKPAGTVPAAPTWADLLPVLLSAYVSGTETGRRLALEELQRMAKIADQQR